MSRFLHRFLRITGPFWVLCTCAALLVCLSAGVTAWWMWFLAGLVGGLVGAGIDDMFADH